MTFVRGLSEDQVFRAFGADPGEAVMRRLGEPLDLAAAIPEPTVRVGRTGEWVFAIEDWGPPQGVRPEVLRRVSSGGAAVAVYEDIGKGNHEFGYAADGDVVAALTTCAPLHWSGSDPSWFESFAAEEHLTNLRNRVPPPMPVAELQHQVRRGDAAALLRFFLDGRPGAQLLAGEFQWQRIWDSKGWQEPLAWRAQAIAALSDVQVPAAEVQAAEEAWLATPEPVRGRVALIDAAPVRAHVNALIASGMDDRQIAELSGRVTTGFIDLLLRGYCTQVSVENARSLLSIPIRRCDTAWWMCSAGGGGAVGDYLADRAF